ncbi:MAG: HD domain-containing protein [Chitinophagaceae bacterium]|nr:HD domain-containing protein [Chitinophagaceae bacterium]
MPSSIRKIINDPVYGFITIDSPLIYRIMSHPYYQRLRRIQQMAFAGLVYPGAVHTRLHHSLGAYHLMCSALNTLKSKGIEITADEETAAKIAILLHDSGHGPFSHALENILIPGVHHEKISLLIMKVLNEEMEGQLELAIQIFTNNYSKSFLYQLVSGQLDVDRMDYLTRDSFFTGVSEGVIGYDRIIKMLTVHNNQLVVEEKGIYSIEKFLVARRLMYWQVYLHKTVLCAEKMLVKIIERAKELVQKNRSLPSGSQIVDFFIASPSAGDGFHSYLDKFMQLDDYDVMTAIKNWQHHPDKILSILCHGLVERRLLKVMLQAAPFSAGMLEELKARISREKGIPPEDAHYLVIEGMSVNTTYDPAEERINILFKNGSVKDISQVDNALIHHNLSAPVKKFYICYINT